MSIIMAVNAGSSSLKFQLLEMPSERLIVKGIVEGINDKENCSFKMKKGDVSIIEKKLYTENHAEAVKIVLDALIENKIINRYEEITGVGHRVVQGGCYFNDSCIVTDEVKKRIEELIPLAPLHNGAHLDGINAFERVLKGVPNVVVFDTSFHQTMPETSYLYGTPLEWATKHKCRKYGAHGTSHQYVANICAKLMNKPIEETKIITCHIGNGASITAVEGGKSIDTSMGLTPLDGFPMGSRSGSLDPTVVSYMCEELKKTAKEIVDILNNKSGYLGISGLSKDSRALEKAIDDNKDPELVRRCQLAFDLQYKRVCDYIGSYYVLLNGADAIVFTAGIGENSARFRSNVCKRLKVLGVEIDEELNEIRSDDPREITKEGSKIRVFVIPTNEELVIARDVIRLTK